MAETVLAKRLNALSTKWKAQHKDAEGLPVLHWRVAADGYLWLDHLKVCRGGDVGGVHECVVYWNRIILSTFYGYLEILFTFPVDQKIRISEIIYHRLMEENSETNQVF